MVDKIEKSESKRKESERARERVKAKVGRRLEFTSLVSGVNLINK